MFEHVLAEDSEDYSSSPVELTATPSEKTLDFPGNSQSYPTFTKATWRITADSQWDLVTVMVGHSFLVDLIGLKYQ